MVFIPLYQVIVGLGTPVTLQASLTVCPSSAVQFARISSKSGGPMKAKTTNHLKKIKDYDNVMSVYKKKNTHSMLACCIAAAVL